MTELGIGAVKPNRRRRAIPTHQVSAHVSRLARRKRKSANTAAAARTTQIFIVSLSQGQPERTLLPAQPEPDPALPKAPPVRLPARRLRPAPALHPERPAVPRPPACSTDDSSGA